MPTKEKLRHLPVTPAQYKWLETTIRAIFMSFPAPPDEVMIIDMAEQWGMKDLATEMKKDAGYVKYDAIVIVSDYLVTNETYELTVLCPPNATETDIKKAVCRELSVESDDIKNLKFYKK